MSLIHISFVICFHTHEYIHEHTLMHRTIIFDFAKLNCEHKRLNLLLSFYIIGNITKRKGASTNVDKKWGECNKCVEFAMRGKWDTYAVEDCFS